MKKMNFDDILIKISNCIINAKNRIYATHLLKNGKDFWLPELYMKSLMLTKCANKKRIIFWNKQMFDLFNTEEKYFINYFSNYKYTRMLLIDNEIFFKIDNDFFYSNDVELIKLFESYFEQNSLESTENIINQIYEIVKNLNK